MALFKYIYIIILFIKICSGQCEFKKVEWCIKDDIVSANGDIVDERSCKTRPCIISTCRSGEVAYNRTYCKKTEWDESSVDVGDLLTIYKLESGKLVPTNKKFFDTFQVVTYKNETTLQENNCTQAFISVKKIPGHFLEDGSFYLDPPGLIVKPQEYVVKFLLNSKKKLLKKKLVMKLKIAMDAEDDEEDTLALEYAMLVSVVFLCLVNIVYALCKDLRTTGGLAFMAYITTLAIAFILSASIKIYLRFNAMSTLSCSIVTPSHDFFVISSYTWMSILGFDLYLRLRKVRFQKNFVNYRKFAWYCVIAWLLPLLYIIIEICLDNFTQYSGPHFHLCKTCTSEWYLAGPKIALQLLSIIPLSLTIRIMLQSRKTNKKHLSSTESNNNCPKQYVYLCLKISILMGTNWFMDVVLTFFSDDLADWLFYTLKAFNSFFGVIVFLVYIFKAEVLLKVFRRFSIDNKITKSLEKRVSRKYSSTASTASARRTSLREEPY